jgi:D-alanyl-lipoteichoic acid acyltransferase DltB (MBOAT superfamily)
MKAIRNTMIVFLISGFWHGANWTFIVWGALNGLYFLPLLISGKNRIHTDTVAEGRFFPTFKEAFQIATTFLLTCFAWIFFRAANIGEAFDYIAGFFTNPLLPSNNLVSLDRTFVLILFLFMLLEWLFRNGMPEFVRSRHAALRLAIYYGLVLLIVFFGAFGSEEFIYFQF